MTTQPPLPLFVSFSGNGGVERMMLNLIREMLAIGVPIDLLAVLKKPSAELLQLEGSGFRLIDLGTRHTAMALPELVRYLKAEHPSALLVAKDRAIRTAVVARYLAGSNTRIVGRLGTNLSAALANKPKPLQWLRTAPIQFIYPSVDDIITVSEGVAEDALQLTGLPRERIHAIANPVITPLLYQQSLAEVDHPWFSDTSVPLILGAGRLTEQKDFATLLKAFAHVSKQRACRLALLGDGALRQSLETLAGEMGVSEHVWFGGFQTNPYAYMAKASLFVVSSRWEGTANVLTEAMALGIPVVATDCPSGPRETLAGGRFGKLVPVGDVDALAVAILETLAHPLEADTLKAAVTEFTAERSARRYLEILGYTR